MNMDVVVFNAKEIKIKMLAWSQRPLVGAKNMHNDVNIIGWM